jgi:NADP-dependent 3-hydroxy acid dehydrogenase YdfG
LEFKNLVENLRVITGTSSGVGEKTAKHLLRTGNGVLLALQEILIK